MILVLNCLLYYSVFLLFLKLEYILYFIIISTLHLRYNIALHWYNFYYFNQHRQDNKPINLSTNKTNKSINLSALVIFLTNLFILLNRTKTKPQQDKTQSKPHDKFSIIVLIELSGYFCFMFCCNYFCYRIYFQFCYCYYCINVLLFYWLNIDNTFYLSNITKPTL